jgi:hypothetical protein
VWSFGVVVENFRFIAGIYRELVKRLEITTPIPAEASEDETGIITDVVWNQGCVLLLVASDSDRNFIIILMSKRRRRRRRSHAKEGSMRRRGRKRNPASLKDKEKKAESSSASIMRQKGDVLLLSL